MELIENRLATLVNMSNPEAVLTEVKTLVTAIFPLFDFAGIDAAFSDIKRLFRGEFPGYRQCNTEYHNLQHTTDCLLAMVRLIHGASIQGETFSRENVVLSFLVALFHDTGYVQANDDREGTGAKYTLMHIRRSIDFMTKYLRSRSYPERYSLDGTDMLNCTGLTVKIREIGFSSHETEILGKMLGTADLLGQMADRTYLEKLLFLYHEFREGEVPNYSTEIEFLQKSVAFYKFTQERLATDLGGVSKYMAPHFKSRWKLETDLYAVAIQCNQEHLRRILEDRKNGHRGNLRRGNVVEKLIKRGL